MATTLLVYKHLLGVQAPTPSLHCASRTWQVSTAASLEGAKYLESNAQIRKKGLIAACRLSAHLTWSFYVQNSCTVIATCAAEGFTQQDTIDFNSSSLGSLSSSICRRQAGVSAHLIPASISSVQQISRWIAQSCSRWIPQWTATG